MMQDLDPGYDLPQDRRDIWNSHLYHPLTKVTTSAWPDQPLLYFNLLYCKFGLSIKTFKDWYFDFAPCWWYNTQQEDREQIKNCYDSNPNSKKCGTQECRRVRRLLMKKQFIKISPQYSHKWRKGRSADAHEFISQNSLSRVQFMCPDRMNFLNFVKLHSVKRKAVKSPSV